MKFAELSVVSGALDCAVLASPPAHIAGVTNDFTPDDRNPDSAGMNGAGNAFTFSPPSQSGLCASAKQFGMPGSLSCLETAVLLRWRAGHDVSNSLAVDVEIHDQICVNTIEGDLLLSPAGSECPVRTGDCSIKINTLDNKYKGVQYV